MHTKTYDYCDAGGALLYQVLRYEQPKSFRQRQPDGNGGWIWNLNEQRVFYRLPDLMKYPFGTVFVTEGEKDADGTRRTGPLRDNRCEWQVDERMCRRTCWTRRVGA